MNILLKNCIVVPMTAAAGERQWYTGSVGISGNRIEFASEDEAKAGEFVRRHTDARTIDCRDKVVMPGLVNTHCHVAMTLQRSSADDIALMEWLNDYIWPFEARQTAGDIELGARLGVVEMLLGGVTSFVDMYWHEASVFEAVDALGMRALLTASCMDTNMDACERDLALLLDKSAGHRRIRAGVSPHAAYTCSPETLRRAKRLCDRHGLPMTMHISETRDEQRMVAERYGKTPVALAEELGLLDERMIAAHCIYMSDSDMETFVRRGVAVAHNPSSNMKISSGTAPVAKMHGMGIRCTIATDGACSNNDLDMWEEMRNASFLQKVSTMNPLTMPAYDILKMATADGAAAIGYGGELGIIAEGALADVIVVDVLKPHIYPLHNVVANLVYCAKASDVETVIVDGRIVVENRRMSGVDTAELCRRVHRRAMELKS